jgi:hypothetical protein
MRWAAVIISLAICGLCLPAAAAGEPGITITANPAEANVGDTVILNGTVTGINTIAVYLFVTGQDLDPRGVSLENLNIPAGRGLFTTAPVHMNDGSWSYEWDTSVIIGTLKPGNYSVYVVSSPMDRLRFNPQEFAVAQVSFAPSEESSAETPIPPVLPVAAVGIAGILFCAIGGKRE